MRMNRVLIITTAVGVIAAIALICTTFLIGVYRWHWENPFVVSISRMLPVPAAKIAGRPILLRDYYRDVNAIKTFLVSDEAKSQGISRDITDADRKQALERLLTESALNEAASLRNIPAVTDAEVDQMIDTQLGATGTNHGDLVAKIQATYGWSYEDFRAHIGRPALLTRYLTASFAVDHPNDPSALQQYLDDRLKRSDVVRYVVFP
jgi:hypothetical protein